MKLLNYLNKLQSLLYNNYINIFLLISINLIYYFLLLNLKSLCFIYSIMLFFIIVNKRNITILLQIPSPLTNTELSPQLSNQLHTLCTNMAETILSITSKVIENLAYNPITNCYSFGPLITTNNNNYLVLTKHMDEKFVTFLNLQYSYNATLFNNKLVGTELLFNHMQLSKISSIFGTVINNLFNNNNGTISMDLMQQIKHVYFMTTPYFNNVSHTLNVGHLRLSATCMNNFRLTVDNYIPDQINISHMIDMSSNELIGRVITIRDSSNNAVAVLNSLADKEKQIICETIELNNQVTNIIQQAPYINDELIVISNDIISIENSSQSKLGVIADASHEIQTIRDKSMEILSKTQLEASVHTFPTHSRVINESTVNYPFNIPERLLPTLNNQVIIETTADTIDKIFFYTTIGVGLIFFGFVIYKTCIILLDNTNKNNQISVVSKIDSDQIQQKTELSNDLSIATKSDDLVNINITENSVNTINTVDEISQDNSLPFIINGNELSLFNDIIIILSQSLVFLTIIIFFIYFYKYNFK